MNNKFKTGKKLISLMLSIAIAVSMFTGITFTSRQVLKAIRTHGQ